MDRRLLQAYELLRDLVSGVAHDVAARSTAQTRSLTHGPGGAHVGDFEQLWSDELGTSSLPNVLTSTTDLLVPWSSEAMSTTNDSLGSESTHPPRSPTNLDALANSGLAPGASTAAVPFSDNGGESELSDDAAESVVDSLYDFVHALERREVEQAMETVAGDFHAMNGDDEIDRDIFRQVLERFLDERPGELRISLARVPEPVPHRLGVLLHIVLQIEPAPGAASALIEGVVIFRQNREDDWRITGFRRLGP